MSRIRQWSNPFAHPEDRVIIRTYASTLPDGFIIAPHSHTWGQLIYACSGVMTVRTPAGVWVTPSHRAVWTPPGFEHSIAMTGTVAARSLYFRPDFFDGLPAVCTVVDVPPLLRELIAHVIELGMLNLARAEHERLAGVVADRIIALNAAPLTLVEPRDPRAARAADWARQSGAGTVARASGASSRTLDRLFTAETGMSFGRWRRRQRLMGSLQLLAERESVANVALESGYQGVSAFVAAFKKEFGVTPGAYFGDRAR